MNRHASQRFQPHLEALEDRCTPSTMSSLLQTLHRNSGSWPAAAAHAAQPQLPFKETLTLVSVDATGATHFEGHATYFGHLTAVLNPDNTFVKTAANGDTAHGYLTHMTATTGTITFTGGTGRFRGISGTTDYVLSTDPTTGATTVTVTGFISLGHEGHEDGPHDCRAPRESETHVDPFKVTGGGTAPEGILLVPGGTIPHNATGTATHLGKYTGEGQFTLLSFTSATTGTFRGAFTFVAANGDRLTFDYGATTPGTFTITPAADGKVVVQFVAIFTPVPSLSTGRFANVTGGSFVMVATTEPFDATPNAQGFTAPFAYTWLGDGWLEFAKEKK